MNAEQSVGRDKSSAGSAAEQADVFRAPGEDSRGSEGICPAADAQPSVTGNLSTTASTPLQPRLNHKATPGRRGATARAYDCITGYRCTATSAWC
mmetsp:Transcript_152196/g.265299  ORF Transcript_152196/g.265299 Transcript_152196/m.265299 type:complete len:95 (+) Transcript_152196:372-656(+)